MGEGFARLVGNRLLLDIVVLIPSHAAPPALPDELEDTHVRDGVLRHHMYGELELID